MYYYTDGTTNDGLLRVNAMSVTNSHQRVKGSISVLDLCLYPVSPLVGLLNVQFPNYVDHYLIVQHTRCGGDLSKCTRRFL